MGKPEGKEEGRETFWGVLWQEGEEDHICSGGWSPRGPPSSGDPHSLSLPLISSVLNHASPVLPFLAPPPPKYAPLDELPQVGCEPLVEEQQVEGLLKRVGGLEGIPAHREGHSSHQSSLMAFPPQVVEH